MIILSVSANISILSAYATYNQGFNLQKSPYIYKENALTHIEVKQYDIEGNSGNDLIHIFQYQDDGALESITKSFPNGYSEIIYKTKRGC